MSGLKITVATAPSKTPIATVIGVFHSGNKLFTVPEVGFTADSLKTLGAKSSIDHVVRSASPNGGLYVLVGLGDLTTSVDELREAGGAVGRTCADLSGFDLHVPFEEQEKLLAFIQGLALGAYAYPKDQKTKHLLSDVRVITDHKIPKAKIDEILVVAEACHTVRNLSAAPANQLYPDVMAKSATLDAEKYKLKVQVWDEKALARDGFGAILAVGQGSVRPPRLVKLVYAPRGAAKHLAIVGKGITFDTGGLAVKPLTGMLGMKYDMTGAAVAYQSVIAIARLGLPIKVTAWLCLAENMVSGSSTRPGDVITAKNGKTIEVTNPDAEGRLVMADGLAAASLEQPDLIVDVATLTGAARVALGVRYAGLIGTAQGVDQVADAAVESGELVWEMPLPRELRKNLESDVADLANMRVGTVGGGMLVAAHFLKEFVGQKANGEQLEWAHLDIAGPADNEGAAYGFTPKGPTGVMLRTMVALARQMSAK